MQNGGTTMEVISSYGTTGIIVVGVVAFLVIALGFKAVKLAVKVAVGMGILALLVWLATNYM